MNDERIIYSIYEDMIQSAAEANLGRQLTEKELKRLACVLIDSPFFDGIYCALIEAAEDAMNNKGGRWNEWDKENNDTPFEKMPYFSYQLCQNWHVNHCKVQYEYPNYVRQGRILPGRGFS